MVHTRAIALSAAVFLLQLLPQVLAHGDDESSAQMVHAGGQVSSPLTSADSGAAMNSTFSTPESYWARPEMRGFMFGHILLMFLAWFFILPIGVVLSIARSRLALPVQFTFLSVHGVGLLLSTIYKANVPDLYPKNSHHRLGWMVTWVVVAQCMIAVVRLAATIGKPQQSGSVEERATFLPVSRENLSQPKYQRMRSPDPYRFSNDSGHFTASNASRSHSLSSTEDPSAEEEQKLREYEATHAQIESELAEKRGILNQPRVQHFSNRVAAVMSNRTLRILDHVCNLIDRTILLLGFITIISGMVVYGGVFRDSGIFSGLAHTIKGGIFFWYGLLTLGRWMGCFVEYGWAWNMRPPVGVVSSFKAKMPSAEFVESFVIFLYGSTNVFLEHLAAWGDEWSPMDLEHVSIPIMFFGGGMCGMLIESTRIRDLLNSVMVTLPAAHTSQNARDHLAPPKTYTTSLNPFPALIILLLGIMMSSHHQTSMFSTAVHKQWGTLFVGFAVARGFTYLLTYLSPPTSYLPSRPPTELISSFCLTSGGIIFMASNRNTVSAMESYGLHAMFPFTLTMGFTAFTMAWTIVVLAIKGWAVRRRLHAFSIQDVA